MNKPNSYQQATAILDRAANQAIVRVRTHRGPKITIERNEEEIEVAVEGHVDKGERYSRDNPEIPPTAEMTVAYRIDNGQDIALTDEEIKRAEAAILTDYFAE